MTLFLCICPLLTFEQNSRVPQNLVRPSCHWRQSQTHFSFPKVNNNNMVDDEPCKLGAITAVLNTGPLKDVICNLYGFFCVKQLHGTGKCSFNFQFHNDNL